MRIKNIISLLVFAILIHTSFVNAQTTRVNAVDWSPDGSRIATGQTDSTVKIWDGNSGQLLKTILVRHPDAPTERLNILSLDWNLDATKLAIGAVPTVPIGIVLVIDPSTEQILLKLRAEDGTGEVAWSLDGKYLAASGTNLSSDFGKDSLIIWDATNGNEIQRINGEVVEGVHGIAWSPDGTRIATSGHLDGAARVWDVRSGAMLATMVGHVGLVYFLDWSTDGSLIASVAQDHTLRVWNAATGQLVHAFDIAASGADVKWSPDGYKIATILSNDTIQISDLSTGQVTSIFTGRGQVDWDPSGNRLVSGWSDGSITIQAAPGAPTLTPTVLAPTAISTDTPVPTPSETWTPTEEPTPTSTASPTETPTTTSTATDAPTDTPTSTTDTPTLTHTPTPTPTNTPVGGVFPATGVLDNFNRADGGLGANWYGNTANYSLVNQQMQAASGGDIAWTASAFSANQEAFVTLTDINPLSSEIDLLLKVQMDYAMIEVLYQPAASTVQVWTKAPGQDWVQRGDNIPVSFANGDQFGARALAGGTVEVYQNGVLLASRDVSAWPYNILGGYIGLWLIDADTTRLDDFGGGDVAGSMPSLSTYQVNASSDDVNESDTTFDPDQPLLWIGNAGATLPGYAGLRFTNVTIPSGAVIQSAHVQVYMPYDQWIGIEFTLLGDAADNSVPFTSSTLPSQRIPTQAQVQHASNANWMGQSWYSLGEIAPVIQELVNRPGWQSGNSLSLLLRGPGNGDWGRKFIVSADSSLEYAPRLVLTYTLPGGGG